MLDLFVNPASELQNPFEHENAIVKGRMGSGKTMFLKANLAYHLYSIVPALIEQLPITLPVFIKLSDFQHIQDPAEIYRAIILRIIEELANTHQALQNCDRMASIHLGMQSLPSGYFAASKLASVLQELTRLNADEYVQRITDKLGLGGSVKPKFLELSARFQKETVIELKAKTQPGISDVKSAYDALLGDTGGQILLLIDEAGSVARSFFTGEQQSSLFETLMNQLRTTEFVRTKIAIYPHTYSDILVETRYGDLVDLSEDVMDDVGYARFRRKVLSLVSRYISASVNEVVDAQRVFDVAPANKNRSDAIEQIINASTGNMRRLMTLLDLSMAAAFEEHRGEGKVEVPHVVNALQRHSASAEALYTPQDREFLNAIAQTCRSRRTFRFQFPYKTPALYKYTSKSDEHNVVSILETGAGRRSSTFAFDYSYCVHHDVPTHYIKGSEKIDESRSRSSGEWIPRVTRLSDELLTHATMFAKIEGVLRWISENSTAGFIKGDDNNEYFWDFDDIIDSDRGQPLIVGRRIKFYPVQGEKPNEFEASAAELL